MERENSPWERTLPPIFRNKRMIILQSLPVKLNLSPGLAAGKDERDTLFLKDPKCW